MSSSSSRFASLALALAFAGLAPSAVHAQEGGATVVIEGTLTFGLPSPWTTPAAPPAPPPAAAPAAPQAPPPVIVVEAPPAPAAPVASAVILGAVPPAAAAPTHAAVAPAIAPLGAALQGAPTDDPRPRTRRRWGLVGAGAGLMLGAYALNLAGTALWMTMPTGATGPATLVPTWNGHREELFLWSLVPVVGPLAQLEYAEEDWQVPLFLVAAALETAGLVMAIVGTASRVRVDDAPRAEPVRVSVAPYASRDGAGLFVGGSF